MNTFFNCAQLFRKVALLLWIACLPLHAAQGSTVVKTADGPIEGTLRNSIYAFKGIPYAAPPIDALRWRAPQPVEPWSETRSARDFSVACMQKPGLSADNGGDPGPLGEDCLTLNVWTPELSGTAPLPVIVWIHGGAFVFGAGGLPIYDGAPMAAKGAVFVSINYRLGPLGFFAHQALDDVNTGGAYNFGLLDQIAALKWVKRNIGKFGGDAGNVTIMGQSAGGKSVLWHFTSPLSQGLFHKGIAQSVYILPDAKRDKGREVGNKVATAVGLNGAKATLKELRSIAAERFFEITDKDAALGPVGIVGDAALPRSIADTFAAGGDARLPLIIGNTSDDASVVAAFGVSPEAVIGKLGAAGFGLKLLYPGVSSEQMPAQALRDIVFTMNTSWVADRHAQRARTWRYYFDYVAVKDKPTWKSGLPHGGDVVYFLNTLDRSYSKRDKAFASEVSDYVIAFAKTGRPTADRTEWSDDRPFRDRTLILGPDKNEQRSNFMKVRLDVLRGVTKIIDTVFDK